MNKYIGERIRIKRELKGLTQQDVAEQLNIVTSSYGKLERGETKIDIERLKEITDLLDTTIEDILDFSIFNRHKRIDSASVLISGTFSNEVEILNVLIKLSDALPLLIEKQNQIMEKMILMIDNKKIFEYEGTHTFFNGNSIVKVLPLPGTLSAFTFPSCASVIVFT